MKHTTVYICYQYLAWWVAIARPDGSVCLLHVGVQRMTVFAHDDGKCSSNMQRYQYLKLLARSKLENKTSAYASLLSGMSLPHSDLGCFIW